jgi:hypothetical protein
MRFASPFEQQQYEALESLRAQAKKNPTGPLTAPAGMAGVLATMKFYRERERNGKAAEWSAKYGAGRCQE